MKPEVTPEKAAEHQRIVALGGIKGGLSGLAVALPLSYALHRKWSYYRSLQPSLKAFGVILIAVPSFVISAERAGLAHERKDWHDEGKEELDTIAAREKARWEKMSAKDKLSDWAIRHQYSVITGTWAASMAGAYAWVARDPLATPLQKITQTRVWAQGLTLGVLLSAAALTHGRTSKHLEDHSWRDIIERQQSEAAAVDREQRRK